MDFDYILNTSEIEKYKSTFQSEVDKVREMCSYLSSSSFAKCSDPKISNLYSKVYSSLNKISDTMSSLNNKWEDYINEVVSLENRLASFSIEGLKAPNTYNGTISKVVDGVVDPTLNGDYAYTNLGYKFTADDFVKKYKNAKSGQCVDGFKDFTRYVGLYNSLYADYNTRVKGNAKTYYTDKSNRKKLLKYFDLVDAKSVSDLQDGDWLVYTSGKYGHICMYYHGMAFGKNQRNVDYVIGQGNPFTLDDFGLDSDDGYYGSKIGKSIKVYRLKQYSPEPIKEGKQNE